jgi:hypothetical protein
VNRGNPGDAMVATREGKAPKGHALQGMGLMLRRRFLKRSEPHGRLQGAIDLRGASRRKPSKSGGTTRTERVWSGISTPTAGFGQPGVDAMSSCRRRGDL